MEWAQSSDLSWTRLQQIAIHTGTVGEARFWPADPQYAGRLWRGLRDPPPPGHVWTRDATQMYLDLKGCREFGVPAFHCRRRFKPPGSKPKVSHPQYSIHCLTISHYQLALHLRRPRSSTPWWGSELAKIQHQKRMEEVKAWAHTGIMVREGDKETSETVKEGERGNKEIVEEGEEMGEKDSETVKEGERGSKEIVEEGEEVWLDIVLSSSEDSEDDPIVKEGVGAAPRLLLNPYYVE